MFQVEHLFPTGKCGAIAHSAAGTALWVGDPATVVSVTLDMTLVNSSFTAHQGIHDWPKLSAITQSVKQFFHGYD